MYNGTREVWKDARNFILIAIDKSAKFFLDIMFNDKLCIIFVFSAWPNLHQLQDN